MNSLLGKISGFGIFSIVFISIILVLCCVLFFIFFPIKHWWKVFVNKLPVSVSKLMALKSKSFNIDAVLDNYIVAKNAGLKLSIDDIESHILAGGNINSVIRAMIAAKNANIKLPFHIAKVIDLSGRDVCSVVQSCIVPKIVETSSVSSVSKDGIELKASASITIKANLGRVLGGADEGTIVSRVSEALVATIGSSVNHKAVLENPDVISDVIFNKGLDSGTAYEIISIDIFDIKVGSDIGHTRRLEQQELESKKRQSKIEEKRLSATVLEQENKAKIQEAKVRQIDAEASVPLALAKALEEGKISPIEYYDIKNLEADTKLRESLTEGKSKKQKDDFAPRPVRPRKNPFDF